MSQIFSHSYFVQPSQESFTHKKHGFWSGIDFYGRRLDIIIFGATGCAGRFTVMEAVRVLSSHSWGIAGRNRKKMQDLLEDIGIKTRRNLSRISIITANMEHKRTLYNLAKKCRVLINCAGPYESYGENVIWACISARTHYIDLCTESQFIDHIFYKFNESAKARGVYVIMGCGLQSLPAEVGVNYMNSKFGGTINNIDAYVEFWTTNPLVVGSIAKKNVWASFILGNRNLKKLQRNILPKMEPVAQRSEADVIDGFCIPAITIDEDIVDRSQLYFLQENNERPIQYNSYFVFSNKVIALLILCWYFIVLILSQFQWTRQLLLQWPRLCTLGLFSAAGPEAENMDDTYFHITFKAEGWCKNVKYFRHKFSEQPNKVVIGRLSGTCPFYGIACVCLLVGAATVFNEESSLPDRGGVYTPGAAFENTGIINELQKYEHGLSFEIISVNYVN